jgi:hypothetical protein
VIGEAPLMAASIVSCTAQGTPRSFRTTALFETMIAPLANCEQPSRFAF